MHRILARTLSVACLLFLTAGSIQIAQAAPEPFSDDPPNWSDSALRPGVSDRPNRPVDRFAISLSEAFKLAHVQNPSVVAAVKNIDVARAQIKTAGARPNPQIAIQYGFGTPYTEVVAGNTQQLGANQLFETGGKRGARLRYARANYILAEYQLADLRYDVRSAVRKAYAELAAAEANAELVENQRTLVERLAKIAEKKVTGGRAQPVEALQAKLALGGFETLRNSALARLRQASIQLDYLLGYSAERDLDVEENGLFKLSTKRTELVPPPDEPLAPLSQLLASAFLDRPDLKAARQQVIAANRAVELQKRQAIPDILIGSGWVFSTYKKSANVRQQEGAYLNVNMDLPVFYRHQGEIAAAQATMSQSQLQAIAMASRVEVDVRAAYAALASARANIAHYQKDLIPLALDVVRKAQDSYENDKSDVSSAIVAQQQYQQTFSTYFDTVVAYQDAWADLETAVGKKIDF